MNQEEEYISQGEFEAAIALVDSIMDDLEYLELGSGLPITELELPDAITEDQIKRAGQTTRALQAKFDALAPALAKVKNYANTLPVQPGGENYFNQYARPDDSVGEFGFNPKATNAEVVHTAFGRHDYELGLSGQSAVVTRGHEATVGVIARMDKVKPEYRHTQATENKAAAILDVMQTTQTLGASIYASGILADHALKADASQVKPVSSYALVGQKLDGRSQKILSKLDVNDAGFAVLMNLAKAYESAGGLKKSLSALENRMIADKHGELTQGDVLSVEQSIGIGIARDSEEMVKIGDQVEEISKRVIRLDGVLSRLEAKQKRLSGESLVAKADCEQVEDWREHVETVEASIKELHREAESSSVDPYEFKEGALKGMEEHLKSLKEAIHSLNFGSEVDPTAENMPKLMYEKHLQRLDDVASQREAIPVQRETLQGEQRELRGARTELEIEQATFQERIDLRLENRGKVLDLQEEVAKVDQLIEGTMEGLDNFIELREELRVQLKADKAEKIERMEGNAEFMQQSIDVLKVRASAVKGGDFELDKKISTQTEELDAYKETMLEASGLSKNADLMELQQQEEFLRGDLGRLADQRQELKESMSELDIDKGSGNEPKGHQFSL